MAVQQRSYVRLTAKTHARSRRLTVREVAGQTDRRTDGQTAVAAPGRQDRSVIARSQGRSAWSVVIQLITADFAETQSANVGSVVAEIHVDNEDTIVVTNMESQSDEDGDGEEEQHGPLFNQ